MVTCLRLSLLNVLKQTQGGREWSQEKRRGAAVQAEEEAKPGYGLH